MGPIARIARIGFSVPVAIVARSAVLLLVIATASARAATIAGKEAKPGPLVEIQFPVSNYFQNVAAEGGNPRPQTGRAVLSFPPGFDPSRRWPIMIVTSTTDYHRTSPMDAEWYHPPADAEGWVILASDATIKPNHDSTPWRLAMLGAALDAMRRDWPQSRNWPVAFVGMSGGAKRSCLLGAMLAKGRVVNICGFFLSGINDDKMTKEERTKVLEQLSQQRWKDAEKAAPEPGPRLNELKGGEPQFMLEYAEYYKNPKRGFHPRAINSNGSWTATNPLSFMNFPLLTYIAEISPRPVLLIHGEKAHSRYFSETAYKAAAEPKELVLVPGANHVDLYDQVNIIPFDKLTEFFTKNLK